MPEAPINEYSDPRRREYQVSPSPNSFDRSPIDEIPKSAPMKFGSQ